MIRFVIEQLAYATRGAAKMFRDDPSSWIRGEYHSSNTFDSMGEPTKFSHCAMGGIDVTIAQREGVGYRTLDEWMEGNSAVTHGGGLEDVIATYLFHDLSTVGQQMSAVVEGTPCWGSIIYYNDTDYTQECPPQDDSFCNNHHICVANVLDEMADGLDALYEWQSELEGYIPMEPITVGQREEVTVRAAQ